MSHAATHSTLLQQIIAHHQQLRRQASAAGNVAAVLEQLCGESKQLVADLSGFEITPLSGSPTLLRNDGAIQSAGKLLPKRLSTMDDCTTLASAAEARDCNLDNGCTLDYGDGKTSGDALSFSKNLDPAMPGMLPFDKITPHAESDAVILTVAAEGELFPKRRSPVHDHQRRLAVPDAGDHNTDSHRMFSRSRSRKSTNDPTLRRAQIKTWDSESTIGNVKALSSDHENTTASKKARFAASRSRTLSNRLFADGDELKQRIRDALMGEQYDITDHYYEAGVCQRIARSPVFENASFFVVILSSLWIAIEIDFNSSEMLYRAEPVFPIMANLFCIFFVFEFIVRAGALKNKAILLSDFSLIFDAILVALIVLETWLMAVVMAATGLQASTGNVRIVVVFRTLRLLRVLRLGRVLRELPELLVIIRGMAVAFKGIVVMVTLLSITIYLSAIVFRVILDGTDLGANRFDSISSSMGTLLIEGTLSGSKGGPLLREAYEESLIYAFLTMLYVLFANILMMGMIAGLLVQTVKAAAEAEREESSLKAAQEALNHLWEKKFQYLAITHDDNGDGCIDTKELEMLVRDDDTRDSLQGMGVDLEGLINISGFIFQQHQGRLTKPQFKKMVLDLRGKEAAKVKDHVETRKFMRSELKQFFRGSKVVMASGRSES